ncbi:MAG: DUF3343 domain-containing protein [Eubacteriales bacterium]|nr:DUF3343 domain-containing protein [Eubacteriales bacterium]
MREKKKYMVLTFRTTTDAMSMEKKCLSSRIPGRLIPVPREITAGCGLAWRMKPEEYDLYKAQIESLELRFDEAVEVLI